MLQEIKLFFLNLKDFYVNRKAYLQKDGWWVRCWLLHWAYPPKWDKRVRLRLLGWYIRAFHFRFLKELKKEPF